MTASNKPVRLYLALVFLLSLSGCATWPKPEITFHHAASEKRALELAKLWVSEARGNEWCYPSTQPPHNASMRPLIMGNGGEILLLRRFHPDDLRPGIIVNYWNDRAGLWVFHVVSVVDGEHFRAHGINNGYSDPGWYHLSSIRHVLVRVVTYPTGGRR